MLETIFRGVFDTQLTNTITPEQFLLCVGASLVIASFPVIILYIFFSNKVSDAMAYSGMKN